MLHELRVENLLLIERAELRLGRGLNVLTGETGAGKTVLAHALDLLLGGKPRPGIVRPGASEAYVEGVFAYPEELRELIRDRLPEDAEEVVLARRVSSEGRTRAYLGGRSATAADLRDVGGALLSFYGQHEHRKLTLASAQLEILDGFCGDAHAARLAAFGEAYARERALRGRLEELEARAGARDRELDLLEWELKEIEDAAPDEDEEASLAAERERLRHLESLLAAAAGGVEAMAGDEGAAVAVAGASRALESVRGVDADLDALADRVTALAIEADDLAMGLRAYGEGVEATPGRLEEVEERLALLDRLKRKHGGTLASVLAHAEECRRRRDELVGDDEEFLIAPNPGVPAGPLREIASGGELSRVMLALMGAAAEAGAHTLVFDEVDAGIGGQTARAVGEQLRELARGRQVICITHLPQIASLADRHFTIVKDVSGGTARTTVTQLERGDLVGELVRMLGADGDDSAARRHARELLKAA